MNDKAYIEITMELARLRGELEVTLEELNTTRDKYHALMAGFQEVQQYIQNHNDICPMGGLG